MDTVSQSQVFESRNRKYMMKGEEMNKEWTRLQSFAAFPADSVAKPLRLAGAGFFYTGSGEEVACFCCGVKNAVWTEEETALEVHQRLSPHCRYMCGEETTNIAINGENTLKNVASSSKASNVKKDCYIPPTKSHIHQSTDNSELHSSAKFSSKEAPTHSSQNHNDRTTNLDAATNGQIELYPGIRHAKPKHPDYALVCARQRSFYLWPEDHVVDPAVLSKAGFFYAGMGDCVRCFFCGGGMKNWQSGDNPWIEHARWFPNCDYVKLCKGDSFANLCNAANLTANVAIYESQLGAENMPDDQTIQDINSVAAKLVLAKGYTQEDVENSIKFVRQKYDSAEMKVQYIVEYLQEINKQVPKTQQPVCGNMEDAEHRDHIASKQRNVELQNSASGVTGKESSNRMKSEKQILMEENRRLKDLMTCKICLDKEAVVAFLPCGHLTSCVDCSKSLRKCAICRKVIAGTVRVYQA